MPTSPVRTGSLPETTPTPAADSSGEAPGTLQAGPPADQPAAGTSPEPAVGAVAEVAPPNVRRAGGRLAWLDALRGIAALAVVYSHFALFVTPELYHQTSVWVIAGTVGVLLFFIISGYIIPASIERKGSLRAFWVSRFFRLYPLSVAAFSAFWLLTATKVLPPSAQLAADPKLVVLAHSTMLQQLLNVPSTVNVMWTLSYEMAFYLLIGALFAVGLHRSSAEIGIGWGAAALIFGGITPAALLSQHFGTKWLLAGVVLLMGVSLLMAVSGRRILAVPGSVLLGTLALGLLSFNQRDLWWLGFVMISLMFAGTTLYRAEKGEIAVWKAIVACTVILTTTITAGLMHAVKAGTPAAQATIVYRQWVLTVLVVVALFSVGMALRKRRIPRVLSWLGTISFSTYLLHSVAEKVLKATIGEWVATLPGYQRGGLLIVLIVGVVALSWVSYQLIELPGQRLGKRVIAALDRRFGSDAHAVLPERWWRRSAPAAAEEPARPAAEVGAR